ncbi:phospholipid scramblase 1-like isoform X2 [Hypomesus transpacificus]|uniref:phospholipid scramblase 1-like isoform X2 n=1 Tax=Hypomesus transpacificus TaxID=137520 RepID=UPI001F087801|nr:phospholipid scramblase 1-like isoform X2 [Hypomesus transpacificus]
MSPYPVPQGGYGDPSHAPPPAGVNMGYQPQPQPGQPIMHQPGPAGHGPMPDYGGPKVGAPGGISPTPAKASAPASDPVSVPPGLEYLTQIDQILMHQNAELPEVILGFETNNDYDIKNILGQQIYKAKETNDCCTRNCLGSIRSFDMMIKDNMGQEVIRLIRPLRCDSCLCPCCLQELWGKDGGEPIGRISKQWSGLLKETFTDADNFGIQFPLDMDVKMKAVLMGTCFLIDFMYFERSS